LIIDGKEYGVHAFMMQIRDENHKPLPGIELGDLGTKIGDNANDTGYMLLTFTFFLFISLIFFFF
jgi:acyl-CoA oxidase